MFVSNIHLVPWGKGRVGLDIFYSENYTTPAVGTWTGEPGPPDLGCCRGLGLGGESGRRLPS